MFTKSVQRSKITPNIAPKHLLQNSHHRARAIAYTIKHKHLYRSQSQYGLSSPLLTPILLFTSFTTHTITFNITRTITVSTRIKKLVFRFKTSVGHSVYRWYCLEYEIGRYLILEFRLHVIRLYRPRETDVRQRKILNNLVEKLERVLQGPNLGLIFLELLSERVLLI